jgi:hypothetical protein
MSGVQAVPKTHLPSLADLATKPSYSKTAVYRKRAVKGPMYKRKNGVLHQAANHQLPLGSSLVVPCKIVFPKMAEKRG